MTWRAEELRRRREALVSRAAAERRQVAAQHALIAKQLGRVDSWLSIARRYTPVAALAAIVVGVVVGPGRILRIVQSASVPALLVRQLLARSRIAGKPDGS